MMLSSAVTPHTPRFNPNCSLCNPLFCPNNAHKLHLTFCRPSLSLTTNASSSSSSSVSSGSSENYILQTPNPNPNPNPKTIRHVCLDGADGGGGGMVSSASAVAAAIRKASNSPIEFIQRIENDGKNAGLVLPSPDFQRLCVEQLDLFRRIVDSDALLSIYVRPAGSYVMDRLELRRVTFYPDVNATDIVILVGNFSIPTGLRAAEAFLLNQQAELIPECRAVVFPMVKHPFVVGFLVAELPNIKSEKKAFEVKYCPDPKESFPLPLSTDKKSWEIQTLKDNQLEMCKFTTEQRLSAVNISRSLAMAYVMDQKAMLLQQSSWQNNVRMSNLVEQIRGPLSSIRTLSKMLSVHVKRSEISYDIVNDIMVQGDRMKDTLQELQDAVYLTKANIVRYNDETLEKMHLSTYPQPDSVRSQLSDYTSLENGTSTVQESGGPLPLSSANKDLEMPMPPLALTPLKQEGTRRPCKVSDVLADLVGAVEPLARKQRRVVELCELSQSLLVSVEEFALRQALSNLIEGALLRTNVGGKVEIVSSGAPAGVLVIIDDDGLDMHYMTQMHSLTPFGADLSSKGMIEDNMTWNFVAGLTVAREILESYGCVLRVISPRITEAALGTGGTRVEIWFPVPSDRSEPSQ